MNVYKPSELAKKLNVSRETIRLWAEEGKIKITKTDGGHRRYIYEENEKKCERQKIIYARVSSAKQESDLKRQIDFLQKKYPGYKVISDIGSGLNYNRKGFTKLLEGIFTGTIEEIVVAYKDRLCRFGFEIIEQLCKHFSTTITVVDDSDSKSEESELAEDIISIITVFSARFHGRRKYRDRKLRDKKISNLSKSTTTKII
jgi:excisionase family DNA binding protein